MRLMRQQRSHPSEGITFFNGFLNHPQQVGSVIPSSHFLKQRIIAMADVASAHSIVELGPGTGGTTRAILNAMQADARLLAIEINPNFLPLLNQIQDSRLSIHNGNACDLTETILAYQLDPPDIVVSGIPFSTMPPEFGQAIIDSISQALAVGGRFVAYQFRDRVETLGQLVFGPAQVEFVFRNIPPLRIYRWQKHEN